MGNRTSGTMNLNPRDLAKAMQRMGIQQQEIDVEQVIIKCPEKDIIIDNPQVAKVNMMGQETFQIVGEIEEREISKEAEINEEDIATVMEKANVDKKTALTAIKKAKGDLAEAILELSS